MAWRCRFLAARPSQDGRVIAKNCRVHPTHWLISIQVVRSIADARSEGKCDGNDCRGFGKKGYGQFLGTTCAAVSGVFTPAVTESETTRTCANDNGRCCNHYNKREDSHRTTLIILLKTPYAIGTIAALFLHLLLPEDRVLDEEKEHYPRAFSDGEIAYET